jgi:hypothetical protein
MPTPEVIARAASCGQTHEARPIDFARSMYYDRSTRYVIPSGGTVGETGVVAFLLRGWWPETAERASGLVLLRRTKEERQRRGPIDTSTYAVLLRCQQSERVPSR